MDRPQKDIMPLSGPERDPSLGSEVAILRAILQLVPSSQTLLGIERLAYNSFSLLLQYILARPRLLYSIQWSRIPAEFMCVALMICLRASDDRLWT